MCDVQDGVVARAEQVSSEFFADFKQKMASRRKSDLPVLAQAGKHVDLRTSFQSA
jgi:DNA mismatch repair protein MSH6